MLSLLVFFIILGIIYFIGVVINFLLVLGIINDFIYSDLYRDRIFVTEENFSNFRSYIIYLLDMLIIIFCMLGSFLTTPFILNFIDNNKL